MIAPTGMDALLRAVRFQSSRKEVLSQCAQVSREEFLSWRDRDASDRLTALHVAILANRHVATLLSYYKVFLFSLCLLCSLTQGFCENVRVCMHSWVYLRVNNLNARSTQPLTWSNFLIYISLSNFKSKKTNAGLLSQVFFFISLHIKYLDQGVRSASAGGR